MSPKRIEDPVSAQDTAGLNIPFPTTDHIQEDGIHVPKAYPHNCKECEYLGSLQPDKEPLDFYLCPNSVIPPSYVIRHGPHPKEFLSFPREVLRRARYQDVVNLNSPFRIAWQLDRFMAGRYKSHRYKFIIGLGDDTIVLMVSPFVNARYDFLIHHAWSHVGEQLLHRTANRDTLCRQAVSSLSAALETWESQGHDLGLD